MEPGCLVEFIESKTFSTGMVIRVKGNKLLILNEKDHEIALSAARVLHASASGLDPEGPRSDIVRALKLISCRRASLAEKVDLRELWELLEGEGEEFSYDFLAGLALNGGSETDDAAAMRRAVFGDGLYFKMQPQSARRQSRERVEEILQHRAREEAQEKELTETGAWLARVWAGETPDDPPGRDRAVAALRGMAIFQEEAGDYKWGQRLLAKAGLSSHPSTPFQALVKLGEMHRHENLDLLKSQIMVSFPPEILKEADELVKRATWKEDQRRDLSGLSVLTIDSSGSEDFDDALSLEELDGELCLYVHIADVSGLIEPGSALDQAALNQAVTVYMPDLRIPMLPKALSEEGLSLREGELRPAFTLKTRLSAEGEVRDFEFFPSLIKVRRRLTYQEADGLVATDPTLKRLYSLCQALKSGRIAKGALLMPIPALNVYLTAEGEIGISLINWNNPGRSMVTEFMILANNLAARSLMEAGAPGIYRVQAEPSQRIIEGEQNHLDIYQCLQQRRFLNRVNWSLKPRPHSSMGLDAYTNLTSPLRRYIDLIVQRQVRSVAEGKEPLYSGKDISNLLMTVEPALKQASKVQHQRRRYWLLRYLETHAAQRFEAVALYKPYKHWRLFIKDLMLEVDLPENASPALEPGQEVMLKIKKVDAREDILTFELD